MADVKTAVRPAKKKKAASKAAPAKAKAASKTPKKSVAASAPKTRTRSAGFETLVKLVDHPLVADLLAVGAMAAVAAIADQGSGKGSKKKKGGSKAVKAAGQAAAAAIGKRLMTEVDKIKKASKAKS